MILFDFCLGAIFYYFRTENLRLGRSRCKNPKIIKSTDMVSDALNVLEYFSITQLVVADNGCYKGIIHLHDILKEGIL